MSRLCETLSDGKACGTEAEYLYATPWAHRYVCDAHANEYLAAPKGRTVKSYLTKLRDMTFTCDWVGEGDDGTCGKEAIWFQNHPDGYQRPLCSSHVQQVRSVIGMIYMPMDGSLNDDFDPRKVPYKPVVQPPKFWGKPPEVLPAPPAPPMPSAIPTSPIPPPPMTPRQPKSVKSAFAELAAAVLDEAKRRVERWR